MNAGELAGLAAPLTASGAGGAGVKLGCGGRCQQGYDTATGQYTGPGGGAGGPRPGRTGGGGTGGGTRGGEKTPAPNTPPAKAPAPQPSPTAYHKAAGADATPPPPKWPQSDPPIPPGVDLEKNMREAEAHKLNVLWFKEQVNSWQPWDFKNAKGLEGTERIEDFGNFNYGATGAALGLPLDVLQWFAGDKQIEQHPNDPQQTTDRWSYPYGDDPRDADMIRRGYEYYKNWKRRMAKE